MTDLLSAPGEARQCGAEFGIAQFGRQRLQAGRGLSRYDTRLLPCFARGRFDLHFNTNCSNFKPLLLQLDQ